MESWKMRNLVSGISTIIESSEEQWIKNLQRAGTKSRRMESDSKADTIPVKSQNVIVHGIGRMTDELRKKYYPQHSFSEIKEELFPRGSSKDTIKAVLNDDFRNDMLQESAKPQTITMTVPLLIRCLEWAKETAKDDVDLHSFTENITSKSGLLDTEDYDSLIPSGDKKE